MEILVSGSDEMEFYLKELLGIQTSGITITKCQVKQSAQLVEGVGKPTYLNGSVDFYTEGFHSNGDEDTAYMLVSEFELDYLRGRVKELVMDILDSSTVKVDLAKALAKSRASKLSRINSTNTPSVPIIVGEEVYPTDKDWRKS